MLFQLKFSANRFRHESQFKNIFHSKTRFLNTLHVHVKYLKIYMKKWSKPFNNFLIIKKDIIKF